MAGRAGTVGRARTGGGSGLIGAGRQLVAMGITVAMATGLVVVATASPASASSFVFTDRLVYGRNQAVIVDVGATTFTTGCEQGADDFLYGVADLYVVRSTGGAPGGDLADVSGAPNTVFGSTGGGFSGEVIGYTAPGGALGPGTYDVVIDECQDGTLGPEDTHLPEAFRVTAEVVGPQLPDIGALKAQATQKADHYAASGELWNALLQLNDAVTLLSAMTGLGGVLPIAHLVVSKYATTVLGLPDPGAILTMQYGNLANHWDGIAADPPDPAFDQPSVLGPTVVPPPHDPTDPLQAAAADAAGPAAVASELSQALLRSIERYQGAAAAGDGEWLLHHARALQADAELLVEHGPVEAGALEDLADAVEGSGTDWQGEADAAVAAIDAWLATGPDGDDRAEMANHGTTEAEVRRNLASWRTSVVDTDPAALAAELRATAAQIPAVSADLTTLAEDLDPVIATLEADPFVVGNVPDVDAGGPYAGTVGAPLALGATARVTEGALTFAWDLDGDGAFDDATGATPTVVPTTAHQGLAGVEVTSSLGFRSVAYTPLEVTGAGPTADLGTLTPAASPVEVPTGTTTTLSAAPTGTPPLEATWTLDGTAVATGSSFAWTPALEDAGSHLVAVELVDGSGDARRREWFATAVGPDDDGDGYWAHVDCDDTEPTTHPGAPELLDGIDNDCDPATPDGGVPPVVALDPLPVTPEGTEVPLRATFTNVGGPYTATVDWGDGTAGVPASVASTTVTADHAYADDGTYLVEVCVTAASDQRACANGEVEVTNEAPLPPRFGDLLDWTVEEYRSGAGRWTVAADGRSVFQSINGDPTFFMADGPLGTSEAGVTLGVETTSDDDLVGFALGLTPGFTEDPDADYLLVDWKQNDQSYTGCDGDNTAEAGLAVSRVRGIPTTNELWPHTDCAANPDGGVTELARATTLGDVGWVDNRSYDFRFRLGATRLQIWVDGELELDLAGDFPTDGRLGFYNYSQTNVRYSGYQLSPGTAVEGSLATITGELEDPGVLDTHTGLFTWGDGSPADVAAVDEADGSGTATAGHTYLQDGSYDAELCVTDDEGASACQGIPVSVANAAPVVRAGPDRASGPQVVLEGTTFSDAGILDAHTATVDWGDGGGPQPAALDSELGEGLVTAAHTYAVEGTYEVAVCVTDDAGDTGCDTFELDVRSDARTPVPEGPDDVEVIEGDVVTRWVAFTDGNPDDSHTASVDWGDGTPGEPVDLVTVPGIGQGGAAHRFLDDGTYTVTFEVCDDGDACASTSSVVTVGNAAPLVSATATVDDGPGPRTFTLDAAFTDDGEEDTHTATVDWGDGSTLEGVPVDQGAGEGTLSADHVYTTADTFTAEVCVLDDDGGEGCTTVEIETGLPGPPVDVSAIGGDGNARVRWQPPASDGGSPLLEYEVEATPAGTETLVPATDLTALVGGLANDVEHTFRVRARNAYGWGPWSEPSNVTLTRPSCPGAPFADVGPSHPFCPEIKWMGDNGVATGWPDGTYRPTVAVSRQAMAAFTYRLLNPGTPAPACTAKPFPDVEVTNSYCAEIAWMKAEAITGGYPDGTFRPAAPVSRQAMAAFLYRLTESPRGADPSCTRDEFVDVGAGHAFCGEVDWLVDEGITGGYDDGSFRPTAPISRQAMAAFVFRYNVLTGHIG